MRHILLVLMLLLPVAAGAGPVSPERATAVAERFLGGSATKAGGRPLKLVWRGEKPTEAVDAAPAYYVFNAEGGGFVIVAGDDAVTPVLAYSREGSFETEGMPANLEDWMERLRGCILEARAKGLKPTAKVAKAWKDAGEGRVAPVAAGEVEMKTALWAQDEPFNRLCPEVDGGRSVTGCAATAISIIMRYHRHPTAGHGNLPDYTYVTNTNHPQTQEGHSLGETYQWDQMPYTYTTGKYSEEQGNAVARLMFDVGVMMEMMYNPTGSGAFIHVAAERLAKYMDYDARARVETKGYTSDEKWMEMVRADIDAGLPVLYGGYGTRGGHAFVADGYNPAGYIHFNWGWRGKDNGYYAVTDVNGLADNDMAVFHLFPNEGGEASNGAPGYSDICCNTPIRRNEPFTVCVDDVVANAYSFTGYFCIGKYNSADQLQELVTDVKPFTGLGVFDYSYLEFPCLIRTPISPGDYLQPCYTYSLETPWVPALFDADYHRNKTVPLVTDDSIRENTRLRFDRKTRILTLTSGFEGLGCTLTGEDGTDCSSAITQSDPNTFIIAAAPLPHGTYTLTLTCDDNVSVLILTF